MLGSAEKKCEVSVGSLILLTVRHTLWNVSQLRRCASEKYVAELCLLEVYSISLTTHCLEMIIRFW